MRGTFPMTHENVFATVPVGSHETARYLFNLTYFLLKMVGVQKKIQAQSL